MITRRRKLALASAILAVGGVAALPFRSADRPSEESFPASNEQLTLRGETDRPAPSPERRVTLWSGQHDLAPVVPMTEAPTAHQELGVAPTLGPLETPALPPRLAETFDTAIAEAKAERAESANYRMHRVADGDTLTSLATKYLGSADHYLLIYQANRDLLPSPDLLPIGREIRIPPASATQQPSKPLSTEDLVPVTPLAPPNRSAAKTTKYTVRSGETLEDIAFKLYGAPARHQEIFAANRDRLHRPQDVRAGMLLVIP